MSSTPNDAAPILFYDGECGLCARSVQWCLDHDRRGVLRFAPLQGETYARLDRSDRPMDMGTVVLLDGDGLHVRGDAVLRLLKHVGGGWRLLGAIGRVVPRPVRDAAYDFVARRRLVWFGGADRCRLPIAAMRSRFLP